MIPYLGKLTQKGIVDNTLALKVAFPSLTTSFFDALINGFIETGFTDSEMKKAIDYVKYTCKYPTPQLAEFINYDGLYSERIKEPMPPSQEEIELKKKKEEEEHDKWIIENNKRNEEWMKDLDKQEKEYEDRDRPPKGF